MNEIESAEKELERMRILLSIATSSYWSAYNKLKALKKEHSVQVYNPNQLQMFYGEEED